MLVTAAIASNCFHPSFCSQCSTMRSFFMAFATSRTPRQKKMAAAMTNGTPDAKAAADRIIGDVREDGLADLIDELWFDGPAAVPSGKDFGSAWGNIESAGGQ